MDLLKNTDEITSFFKVHKILVVDVLVIKSDDGPAEYQEKMSDSIYI